MPGDQPLELARFQMWHDFIAPSPHKPRRGEPAGPEYEAWAAAVDPNESGDRAVPAAPRGSNPASPRPETLAAYSDLISDYWAWRTALGPDEPLDESG